MIEHWDGRKWSRLPVPSIDPTANLDLSGVAATAASDVWAVGIRTVGTSFAGAVLHYDGSRWSQVAAQPNSGLDAVIALSARDVWTVGGSGSNKFVAMHWNGAYWKTFLKGPDAGSFAELASIAALSPDNVWAVGSTLPSGMGPGDNLPALLHWDGTSWATKPPPPYGDALPALVSIVAQPPHTLWVAGDDHPATNPILWQSTGRGWSQRSSQQSREIDALAAGLKGLWAVGSQDTGSRETSTPIVERYGC